MFENVIAIVFILITTGLLWMAYRWAKRRGYMGERNMIRLTLAVFSLVFLTNLVDLIRDPMPEQASDLTLQWGVLLASLAVIVICGIKVVRAR